MEEIVINQPHSINEPKFFSSIRCEADYCAPLIDEPDSDIFPTQKTQKPSCLSVLFVDDERHLLDSLVTQFRKQFNVYTAESMTQAQELLCRTWVDVIVSDLRMPGNSGLDLLRWIKTFDPHISRILLSGHVDVQTSILAINDLNIFRLFSKPCAIEELKDTILQAGLAAKVATAASLPEEAQTWIGLEEVVHGLNSIMEVRDPVTATHQEQVARLSLKIGKRLGLDKTQLRTLDLAAQVHDIGNMMVPLAFINQCGPLNDAKHTAIREHSTRGYEMLCKIKELEQVATIVLQHHERIDGSGYPNGLTGRDILPEARILLVADMVDAITSHRPYCGTFGIEAAKEELGAKNGVWYDGDVVEAALAVISETTSPNNALLETIRSR